MKKYLNFGCGVHAFKGWENVDIRHYPNCDKHFHFEEFPYPYEDDTFEFVLVNNVLEHMLHPLKVIEELHRICKKDAIIKVIVPFYNSGGAYNCITHYHYFNKRTMEMIEYLTDQKVIMVSRTTTGTKIGKYLPTFIREPLSFFIGTLTGNIIAKYKVVK